MANQFLKLRRSNVPGRIPTTSSLDFGEIAINTYDGLAFIKKSGSLGEQVISIGVSSSYASTASYVANASSFPYTGSAVITGSLILTGSLNMTEQFANGGSTNYSSAPISIRTIGTDIPAISIYKAGFSEVNTLQFLSNDLSARWSIGQGYVGNGGVYDLIIGRYSASIWSETARFVHSNGSLTISSSIGTINNTDLVFKRGSIQSGLINSSSATTGMTAFGYGITSSASDLTAFGFMAGTNVRTAGNTAIGNKALFTLNTSVDASSKQNTAVGTYALQLFNFGADNTAIGYSALGAGSGGGNGNTAIGSDALITLGNSTGNTGIGYATLRGITIGNYNTAIGFNAGRYFSSSFGNNTNGSYSVFLGAFTYASSSNDVNQIVIAGYDSSNVNIGLGSNTTLIGNNSTNYTFVKGSLILGSTTPVSSSLLTMNSTSSGFLPPRMTTTQRDAISSPAIGLQIYNTTSNTNDFYNGSSWQNIGSVPTKTTSAANLFNYYNFF